MSYLSGPDDSLAYLLAGLSPDERVQKDAALRSAKLRGDVPPVFDQRPRWGLEDQTAQMGLPDPAALNVPPPQAPPMAPPPPGSAAGAPQGASRSLPLATAAQRPGGVSATPPVTNDLANEYGKLDAREQAAYAEQQRMLQPPDYAKAQEAYQKRAEGGGRQMMLALAAQRAGEGFNPMQAHFLKRAAEAEAPMKMLGGQMTPEGFIEDPEYRQELALKRNDAELRQLAAAKASNVSLQEKARIEAREEVVRREQMQTQLQIAGIHAAAAGAGRADRQQQGDWRIEDSLSKQFDAQTKTYAQELDATRKLGQLAPGQRPNAIEQQSMMVLLNKFLDPGSVVREGEFNRVAQAQGLVSRASNIIDMIARGEPMSNELIANVRGMAKLYEQAATSKIQQVGDLYVDKASRRGLDPTNVVVSPYYVPREQRQAPGGGGAPVRVNSAAEAAKLAPGTPFITPDGQQRVRQ